MTRTDDTGSVCFVPCGRRKSRSVIVYHQCEACTGAFHGFGFVPKSVAVWTVLQCFFFCCLLQLLQTTQRRGGGRRTTVHNPPDPTRTHVQLCADCPSGRVFSQQRKRTSRPPRQREGGKGPYGRIGAARKAVVPLECIPYSSVCVRFTGITSSRKWSASQGTGGYLLLSSECPPSM